ncbi:hypothetical protein ACHAW5_009447 [Stephanodiscus triporus]|uniref:subtilisin n=1 Tax=Stephanodiscus triporus TaxID=2934178 RepID=A0ABD3R0D4_9STRA
MMRSIIFVVTSALVTAAAASLPASTATKEADEKNSPRRLGQTHAEPPISPTSPLEESNEGTSPRRLGMTHVETAATPETVTYIIKFEDTAASPGDRCEALALANGGVVRHVYKEVVNGCSLTMPLAEVGAQSGDVIALGDYPNVASIEKDRKVWAFEDGEDNIFDSTSQLQTREFVPAVYWNLDREDQCKLPLNGQATRKSATGTRVYVLDTGIQANHEEFKGLIDPNDHCHHNVVEARALTDNNGHGTHVAATICGNKSGIATGCTLCSVKVLDVNGSGSVTGIIAGIDHAMKDCKKNPGNRCVINMSLGLRGNSQMITEAMANAVRGNIVVVLAAGNSNDDACKYSPAGITVTITVGSTTKADARSYLFQ